MIREGVYHWQAVCVSVYMYHCAYNHVLRILNTPLGLVEMMSVCFGLLLMHKHVHMWPERNICKVEYTFTWKKTCLLPDGPILNVLKGESNW